MTRPPFLAFGHPVHSILRPQAIRHPFIDLPVPDQPMVDVISIIAPPPSFEPFFSHPFPDILVHLELSLTFSLLHKYMCPAKTWDRSGLG